MRVIKGLNSRYTLLDLITGKEKDYHVSDMKPFVFDSALVDPLNIARRDQMEFFIVKISDHRGKLSHRKSLQFFVSWMGYDQSYDSWESYANLRHSDHLTQLIPSKFRQVNHSPERNLAFFEDFLPLLLSLMVNDWFSEVFSQ